MSGAAGKAETGREEILERLQAMVTDHGEHWDLSEKDEQAIAWILDRVSELERERDRYKGVIIRFLGEDFIDEMGGPSDEPTKR